MQFNDPHAQLREDAQSCLDELRMLHGRKDELKRQLATSTVTRENAQRAMRLLNSALRRPPQLSAPRESESGRPVSFLRKVDIKDNDTDQETLLAELLDPYEGIRVEDRRYHLRTYPQCFVGSQLIDWFIAKGWAITRAAGLSMGRQLAKQGLFYHVAKANLFEDGLYYYRFKERLAGPDGKEPNCLWEFASVVKLFSIALPARLGQAIERKDSQQLRHIKELRQSVMYLGLQTKGWKLQRSQGGLTTHTMDKVLQGKNKRRYNTRIVRSVGYVDVSPAQYAEEFLNLATRQRWQPLFESKGSRVLSELGPNTRILHRCSLSPLQKVCPRDSVVFQDYFWSDVGFAGEDRLADIVRRRHSDTHSRGLGDIAERGGGSKRSSHTSTQRGSTTTTGTQELVGSPPAASLQERSRQGDGEEGLSSLPPSRHRNRCVSDASLSSNRRGSFPPVRSDATKRAVSSRQSMSMFAPPAGTDVLSDAERQTYVVYELSALHKAAPPMAGSVRADVLLVAHVLRPVKGHKNKTEVTIVSQIDFKGSAPEWYINKWLGTDQLMPATIENGGLGAWRGATQQQQQHLRQGAHGGSQQFEGVLIDRYLGSMQKTRESPVHSTVGSADFEITNLLGSGAYSKIWQVRHKTTLQVFAMKVLAKEEISLSSHAGHVMTERSILKKMNHPFIVKLVYDFQTTDKLYFVMSYAAGGDLFTFLRRQALSEGLACCYAAELVLALRYLHNQGVAHRDLKPENVLIGADGHLLLADFGLSKENMGPRKRTYSLSGTAEYLAPEMLMSKGHGFALDWWQLGIVLHEMLSGQHPFYDNNTYRLHTNVRTRPPRLSPDISNEARNLVEGLLEKDEARRLGVRFPRDVEDHLFFEKHNIDWDVLLKKELKPEDCSAVSPQ